MNFSKLQIKKFGKGTLFFIKIKISLKFWLLEYMILVLNKKKPKLKIYKLWQNVHVLCFVNL